MPKLTVLDMTQDILSDMDSDNVNSINDTEEAMQVAQILETTYYEILNTREWPHLNGLITLIPSGDNLKPTHMMIPEDVARIEWIKYNKADADDTYDKYDAVTWMEPEEFLEYLNTRKSSDDNIIEVDHTANITFNILNDRAPSYWTSFDDEYVIFDAYDSDVDSTLQASKLQSWGNREPTFSKTDSFIPDLPAKAFPYLLSEAKSVAFNTLKQSANPKEEQRSRRQRIWLARNSWKQDGKMSFPDYGRK